MQDISTLQQDNAPIIIIGSGMAGYSLAREIRKLNNDLPITIICRDSGDSYAKPTLSNAFAQGKLADTIANANVDEMTETLNIKIYNFYNVSHINANERTITIHPVLAQDKQQTLVFRDLVLATGAHSRTLPNIEIDQKYIFTVNHLDEYKLFQQTINSLIEKKAAPINIAVIGAGLIGCEFANDLVSRNSSINPDNSNNVKIEISVFDKSAVPLAQQLPNEVGELLQQALTQAGVNFHLNSDIIEVRHNDNQTLSIVYQQNHQLLTVEADLILVAVGLLANTHLAEQSGIALAHNLNSNFSTLTHLPRTTQQGISVNQYLQTSLPHIYAIGDCANVMGSYMPYVMPLMNQAKALARTLADNRVPATTISYPAMPIAIKTPNLPLVFLPVSAQFSDEEITWQKTLTEDGMIMTAHPTNEPDKLLGFVLAGKQAAKQRLTLAKQVTDWL